MSTTAVVGPMSPDIMNFEPNNSAMESPPQSLDVNSSEAMGMLLITANVGSIFDDPQHLEPQWLAQVCQQIRAHTPAFVAIHCQEVIKSF